MEEDKIVKSYVFKFFVMRMYHENRQERWREGLDPYKNTFGYYRKNRAYLIEKYKEETGCAEETKKATG